MKKVIRWIVLIWSIVGGVDILTDATIDWYVTIWGLVYAGLIIGLMIDDLRKSK